MELFVFGTGGHAKVVSEVIEAGGRWRIAGYVTAERRPARFLGREVIEEAHFLAEPGGGTAVLALGDNAARKSLCERIGERLEFPVIVHPSAVVSPSCRLGAGSVVMPNAVLNAEAALGRHCVVNSGAVVEHDCYLEDFVSLAPRAAVCGACRLGEGCYVGAGATVIQGRTLGPWSMIGAGAAVCADVAEATTAVGVPARAIGKR